MSDTANQNKPLTMTVGAIGKDVDAHMQPASDSQDAKKPSKVDGGPTAGESKNDSKLKDPN